MCNVGHMFDRGIGCVQSYFTAADWYRRAASQGSVVAKVNLGELLACGKRVESPDYAQANALFREAIEAGNINALYQMGYSCFHAWPRRGT